MLFCFYSSLTIGCSQSVFSSAKQFMFQKMPQVWFISYTWWSFNSRRMFLATVIDFQIAERREISSGRTCNYYWDMSVYCSTHISRNIYFYEISWKFIRWIKWSEVKWDISLLSISGKACPQLQSFTVTIAQGWMRYMYIDLH